MCKGNDFLSIREIIRFFGRELPQYGCEMGCRHSIGRYEYEVLPARACLYPQHAVGGGCRHYAGLGYARGRRIVIAIVSVQLYDIAVDYSLCGRCVCGKLRQCGVAQNTKAHRHRIDYEYKRQRHYGPAPVGSRPVCHKCGRYNTEPPPACYQRAGDGGHVGCRRHFIWAALDHGISPCGCRLYQVCRPWAVYRRDAAVRRWSDPDHGNGGTVHRVLLSRRVRAHWCGTTVR